MIETTPRSSRRPPEKKSRRTRAAFLTHVLEPSLVRPDGPPEQVAAETTRRAELFFRL
jgi:hypothetical protein